MKKRLSLLVFVGLLTGKATAQYQYPFQNPALAYQERVENLISLLTPEEKVDLLTLPKRGPIGGVPQNMLQ